VPSLENKTAQRASASHTAARLQARTVPVSLDFACLNNNGGTVWTWSGTAVPDISA